MVASSFAETFVVAHVSAGATASVSSKRQGYGVLSDNGVYQVLWASLLKLCVRGSMRCVCMFSSL